LVAYAFPSVLLVCSDGLILQKPWTLFYYVVHRLANKGKSKSSIVLEADRMRGLDITKENLDNQRNAVQEEHRRGVDHQPYGKFFEKIGESIWT
jgi:predicted Zn-dependent peptidase